MSAAEVAYLPRAAILEAAERFETPFFLYDERVLRANCRKFKEAFSAHFPDFAPLFALKANPNPEILKIVMSEGYGVDASSEAEVWLAHKLGASGMYTGNYTPAATLRYAKERGFILNLDDIANARELDQIGAPPQISFRINPGVGKARERSCVMAGPDAKYGAPSYAAVDAYRLARDAGVKSFGIHMMTGSNVPTEEKGYFSDIVNRLFDVVGELKARLGIEIEFMNIGGGFGVPYHPDERSLDLDGVAREVRAAFDARCPALDLKPPRLMAEPGRYIAANAGWLVTRVTIIKDSYKKFVGVDACSNDMPRPAIYGAYHHISVLNDSDERETVSIAGGICENNDQFGRDRLLPVCSPGDVVAIHNCGAHAYAMGHNYNGRLRHAEYLRGLNGDIRQIRRAETLDDYFRTVAVEV